MPSTAQAQFRKDDIVTVTIEDLGASGEGIGHAAGFTLFIKDALPGDTVRAKIMKVKRGYGFARLVQTTEPSPFRVLPQCPAARPCGGCQVQELAYEQQLEFKYKKVREDLIRIGGFRESFVDDVLRPVLGMEEPWRFRNKAQYPVGGYEIRTEAAAAEHTRGSERKEEHRKNALQKTSGMREPVAGFYAGRTHRIIPVEDCRIGAPENAAIVRAILTYMKQYHVPAYHEASGEGLVRHILIRNGHYSGEIMVCLVVNGTRLPKEDRLVTSLRTLTFPDPTGDNRPRIVSICLNVNTEKTNVIMGREVRILWGKDAIEDSLRILDVLPERGDQEEHAADPEAAAGPGRPEKPEGSQEPQKPEEAKELCDSRNSLHRRDNSSLIRFRPSGQSVTFHISPLSFYQVNPRQTEQLYSLVRYYAGLTGQEIVWDLYCGVGTISCFLARDAKEVYGVEVIPDAIRDARVNARRNGLDNITFEVGKAEEVIPAYVERILSGRMRRESKAVDVSSREEAAQNAAASGKDRPTDGSGVMRPDDPVVDVIVVDPPRKGCDPACLQTILNAGPRRIVYVSCDPATLARDLRILTDGGYTILAVQPVDMFPHTIHVETVVYLSNQKLKPDFYVDLTLDMKGYHRIVGDGEKP